MKRIFIYTAAIAASLLMAGCAKELTDENRSSEGTGFAEGEKATFCFTPNFGECQGAETKALALMPDVKNIYFAVFDGEGFKLAEYAEAVPNTFADKNAPNKFSYSVELTVTDQPRIIHIIANAPQSLTFGSEAEVIGSLCTYLDAQEIKEGVQDQYSRKDAYWERIVLEDGVWPEPDPDTKDTDPQYTTKYTKYMNVVNILAEAKLTRNFTQLTVSNYDTDDFRVTGFWLTNVPDRGSIAPYNRNTGAFQTGYGDYPDIDSMRDPFNGNYQGFFPATAQLISIAETDGWQDSPVDRDSDLGLQMIEIDTTKAAQKAGNHAFCYEREVPKSNPLYVIVAGKYDATADKPATFNWESVAETYYKIDLKDEHDTYFPILRNFNYKVNIKDVKRAGASTVEGALSAAPSGDIDSSLDMLGLTNISDGVSQIFVSETDVVLVGNNAVQLRYKYIPNLASATTTANITKEQWEAANSKTIDVAGTNPSGNHPDYVTIEHSAGTTGAVFVTDGISVATADETGGNGYRVITLTPTTPLSYILSETVTITGHHWDGVKWVTLSRVVNYKLREKLSMSVSCSPTKVEDQDGQNINVVIGLEAGLPSSIFSLNMDIEARGLSITANNKVSGNDLPVTTGSSTIPSNTKPAYYFTRTITWTEYQNAPVVDGYKYFTSYFKTNKVLSTDQIYVSNKYFNQANTTYTTYTAEKFTALNVPTSAIAVGSEGTVSFTMSAVPADNKVLIGLIGFEKAPSETGISFTGEVDSDGFEIYEMTGVTTKSGSFKISPYRAGSGLVKLYADEFRPIEKVVTASGSTAYTVIVDEDGGNDKLDDLVLPIGTDVAGGHVVVGQKAQLTAYVSQSGLTNVTIDGIAASQVGTDYVLIDGNLMYKYRTTNGSGAYTAKAESPDTYGAGKDRVSIKVGGTTYGSADVPVWGISRSGTALGNKAPSAGKWYIFQNVVRSSYYAYNNGSTLALHNSDVNTYPSLLQFTSTGSTTQLISALSGNQVVGTNGNFSFGTTGTTYTRDYSSGMRLYYKTTGYSSKTYYWRATSNTAMSMSTSTDYTTWNAYEVTFHAPAE